MNLEKNIEKGKTYRVFWHFELASLLQSWRELLGLTRHAVEKKYQDGVVQHKGEQVWDEFSAVVQEQFGGFVTRLEAGDLRSKVIQLPNVPLAELYELHTLMLDTFRSKPVHNDFLLHHQKDEDDFERVEKAEDKEVYGENVQYWIPRKKLFGTYHISIADLEIKPGGESIIHHHQGDELLYIEKGAIELTMINTGLRVIVDAGKFIHFEGGQTHRAYNPYNETANIFLIRYLQLQSGTRNQLFKELSVSKPALTTTTKLIREMQASAWAENTRQELSKSGSGIPNEVFDRCGLGHFLQLLCSKRWRGRISLDNLAERASSLYPKLVYNRLKFARLHHGGVPISRDDLEKLGGIYGVSRWLFSDFLFPAFRYAVVVGKDDMRKITVDIPPGLHYWVPSRHLAYSDITIARIELEPHGTTGKNHHPGFELLKPLEGETVVTLCDTPVHVHKHLIKKDEFAYFRSDIDHIVENCGEKSAEVLVLRFLE